MKNIEEIQTIIKNDTIFLCDLDGTLIDTDEINFLSYQEAIKKVKNIDLKLLYKINKRFTQEQLCQLIPSIMEHEFNEIIKIKKSVYVKYLDKTKVNIKTFEAIEQFSNTHKLILVTNSSKNRAIQVLKYHKLINIFDYQFFKEDYTNISKDKFDYVIKKLNIDPKQIIVFENDTDEIKQAISSGIPKGNIVKI